MLDSTLHLICFTASRLVSFPCLCRSFPQQLGREKHFNHRKTWLSAPHPQSGRFACRCKTWSGIQLLAFFFLLLSFRCLFCVVVSENCMDHTSAADHMLEKNTTFWMFVFICRTYMYCVLLCRASLITRIYVNFGLSPMQLSVVLLPSYAAVLSGETWQHRVGAQSWDVDCICVGRWFC